MSHADARPVTTDALETLGTIITSAEKRDAIHLAVEPVEAGERLKPSEHVFLRDGKAYGSTGATGQVLLGIVDPFLADPVRQGQWFWLVVYPRQIKSLRHVWEHPAFPPSQDMSATAPILTDKAASEAWIAAFADRIRQHPKALMDAADRWAFDREYTYDNSESYKEAWDEFPEFWKHYEVVTGRKPGEPDDHFFTCSC